jgi:hypothetical protein
VSDQDEDDYYESDAEEQEERERERERDGVKREIKMNERLTEAQDQVRFCLELCLVHSPYPFSG